MGLDATPSLSLHRCRQPDVETPQALAGCELLSYLYLYIVVDNPYKANDYTLASCELLSNLYLYIVVDNLENAELR